jgi:uncharacterized protein (DUF2237 family)
MAEKNVLGGDLLACSYDPLTGYFRDGSCSTHDQDGVAHLVCVQVTKEFLEFSVSRGNDLVTPRPEMRFPRPAARQPLVPARAALDRSLGSRARAARGARGDARERAELRAAVLRSSVTR